MSENKKPENLLAEIWYSPKRFHAAYFEYFRFKHSDEVYEADGGNLTDLSLKNLVTDALLKLLNKHMCGIVINPPSVARTDTVD